MGSGHRALKAFSGVVIFVGVIGFLLVGISANCATDSTPLVTAPSTRNFKHPKVIGKERHLSARDIVINYVSKRRVPNGPDPIHNRKAVKYRQPPGA